MITVYPEYNTIEECGMIAVLNAEEQFNEMMESIGKDELRSVLENGVEALNESESDSKVKQIFKKIADWFKKRWEDIQGLFEKFLNKIDKMIKDHRAKKIDKLAPKMKEIVKKLKEKDKDGKEKVYGKTFEYNGLDTYLRCNGEYMKAAKDLSKKIEDLIASGKEVTDEDVNDYKDELSDKQFENIQKLKEETRKAIRGKEVEITKKYICDHIDDILKDAIDPQRVKKDTSAYYKEIKKEFETTISKIQKAANGKDASEAVKSCVKLIPTLKKVKTGTAAIASVVLSELGKRKRTSSMLVFKLRYFITLREKGTESATATNESAIYASRTFQTELTSLFNF